MAAISPLSRSSTSSVSNNSQSHFEIEYSPSDNGKLESKSNATPFMATTMIINPNYNNINPLHSPPSSIDSGIETTSTPNGLGNPNSVNNIINSFSNLVMSPRCSESLHNAIGFFDSNTSNGNSNSFATEKCLRCGSQVYSLERIGPIKGNIYHKTCFKCLVCERQLDLKTYYTNQIDLNERQIYCQSHAPKSGKGVFGADNLYIHNILNAPKLNVMQKVENKPKVKLYKNLNEYLTIKYSRFS